MKTRALPIRSRRRTIALKRERGAFLLEALMSVLIVAFGIIGLLGLMMRSMQHVDDAKNRSEAAFLAHALVSQMWISDRTTLPANFASSPGTGASYIEFKNQAHLRLPGVVTDPVVTFSAGPTLTSQMAEITISWQSPGDPYPHQYVTTAIIGINN